MESLNTIFGKYGSDKGPEFHNYCRQYDTLLAPFRELPIRLLEIGVFSGESLKIWREVFSNAAVILGIDVDEKCKRFNDPGSGIAVEIGDATEPFFIEHISLKHGPFDIVLDDGSHRNDHVFRSFETLFPKLNDRGLYIVEDTVCYKSADFINPSFPSHLEYFFQFTKFLNQWRHDSEDGIKDNCVDPYKIIKKTNNPFECSIDKIDFGCSFVAIHKMLRKHWMH